MSVNTFFWPEIKLLCYIRVKIKSQGQTQQSQSIKSRDTNTGCFSPDEELQDLKVARLHSLSRVPKREQLTVSHLVSYSAAVRTSVVKQRFREEL